MSDEPAGEELTAKPAGEESTVEPDGEREPLAAVVEKSAVHDAIESLRREGIYDDSRKIRPVTDPEDDPENDPELIELPITTPPTRTDVREVVRQSDPEPRAPGLEGRLEARGWNDAELANAPGSWAVIGSVILVRLVGLSADREQEVGEALLSLHGEADTVLAREGIDGDHREPDVRVVAGSGDTETIHAEHGTRYALDLSRVMFSPGNKAERRRMGDAVGPDERVLDMFAGIGYFTLPMARAGATVTAVERNPIAFRYLLENAALNDVEDRIDAYRADCRDVVGGPGGDAAGLGVGSADRVVMGYYDAPEYLAPALGAIAPGGIVHLHAAVPEAELWEHPIEELRAEASALDRSVEVLDRRRVKTHSAGVAHVVVDAMIE